MRRKTIHPSRVRKTRVALAGLALSLSAIAQEYNPPAQAAAAATGTVPQ